MAVGLTAPQGAYPTGSLGRSTPMTDAGAKRRGVKRDVQMKLGHREDGSVGRKKTRPLRYNHGARRGKRVARAGGALPPRSGPPCPPGPTGVHCAAPGCQHRGIGHASIGQSDTRTW